jgi:hypothetical protein
MKVIATRTDDVWGLVEEDEFISVNEELKQIFLEFGWVKPYDDTKPLPPKGLNDYEDGMSYPANRYVVKNDSMYKSNCITSTSWVNSEWDIKITGSNSQ